MTAPQADGAGPSSAAATRLLRPRTVLGGLAILLLVGLIIRLTLAYVLLPRSGFESDVASFTAWALRLAENGPGSFYSSAGFADYPPGYLYVLWLVGGLGHLLAPFAGGDATSVTTTLIKLPSIFADVLVGLVLFFVVRSWRAPRLDANRLGLLAGAIYLFNPVTWYDSAIWGQTDAFGALIVLVTIWALIRGNSEGAAGLAVLGALIKPQFGVVLLPIVGIVLLRRHLLRPGSGPHNRVLAPAAIRSWFETEQGPWRLVSSAVVAFALLMLLITPFSLNPFTFVQEMAKTASGYPYLSVNAFNPWALFGSEGNQGIAFGGQWSWSPDTDPWLGPVPGVLIGTIFLAIGFAIGVARLAWREGRRSILIVGIFLALAFFMLPTRVHERYMFPIFGLLPLLAVVDRRWLWATITLSAAAFINLHGVLTTPLYASPNLEHLPFGAAFRETPGILIAIALNVISFAFVAWSMRRSAADEPDPYGLPALAGQMAIVAPGGADVEASDGSALVPAAGNTLMTVESVPAIQSESFLHAARRYLRRFIGTVSVRRDRSALLAGESGGRLDRRDALLLLVVFLSSFLLRTYRLEVPYSMHFDEVYHARTAMEFLQDWQYDMPHSIYEYTHPHLAKYVMALGIMALGDNKVTSTQELGTNVKDATSEARWGPREDISQQYGERMYVATDAGVTAYDLKTRQPVATIPGTFDHLAMDEDAHRLYLADNAGSIWSIDTTAFDVYTPSSPGQVEAEPVAQLSNLNGDVTRIGAAAGKVIVLTDDGTIVAVDPFTGEETARTTYPDPTSVVGITAEQEVVVDPSQVTDPIGLAQTLSGLLDRDADSIQTAIQSADGPVAVAGFISKATGTALRKKIDAKELPGVTVQDGSGLAIGLSTGVVLLDSTTLKELAFFGTFDPVTDLTLVKSGPEFPMVYAAAGDKLVAVAIPNDDAARVYATVDMPNTVQRVTWNPATTYVHALGQSQDGTSPTVYVVEPRSNAVFADARLPDEPQALVWDVNAAWPAEDRNDLLAIDGAGQISTVDTGNIGFAYRFPGVLVGSLMAVCIYLLARFLFARRSVALIASLLALADGMFFANARIAMNDTYVAFFIVAAFTLFVPIWLGRWRNGAVIATSVAGVGVLLGLALASKWVGAYAIGCVGLLILLRSALGRVIALISMIGLTALLGYLAITPNPTVASPQLNFPFLILMLVLTAMLAVAMVVRPVRMTRDELRLAIGLPVLGGLGAIAYGVYRTAVATPGADGPERVFALGAAAIGLGVALAVVARYMGSRGRGPLATAETIDPDHEPASPPPPRGWLRPGSGLLGLPWLLALGSIIAIPLVVYVISYIPWINLGNQWFTGYPAGHTGQTFLDLQTSMYDYHNYLRATHPASSPWWAWPLDLKPVWFEQQDYAGGTTAVIYDTGNLVIFWLSIPAVAWGALMAWKRRSLSLTFVTIAIASLWLPWARIDRATFQYHIFTTLPFSFMALAYFLAELWHGPSRRTWALARVAAAIAIIGPPLLWLIRLPLCALARTEQVNSGTEVCGSLSRTLTLTDLQVIGFILAVGGLAAAGALYYSLRTAPIVSTSRSLMLPVAFSIALLGVAVIVIGAAIPGQNIFEMKIQAEWPALAALALLLIPAYFVLRAKDPRRYVVGALIAAVVWFVLFYPNIASLPVPTPLSQIHLGLLPTWNWGFQFGVNLDAPNRAPIDFAAVGLLALMTIAICLAAVYAVRAWRATPKAEDSAVSPLPEAG